MSMSITNTEAVAAKWTEFIAGRSEFPAAAKLRAAFQVGRITRLCDCGCNAFEFEVPEGTTASPLAKQGGYDSLFELSFEVTDVSTSERKSLEFILFADNRGHFAGIEVDYCGNSFPVPESLEIHEPPYHVSCSPTIDA